MAELEKIELNIELMGQNLVDNYQGGTVGNTVGYRWLVVGLLLVVLLDIAGVVVGLLLAILLPNAGVADGSMQHVSEHRTQNTVHRTMELIAFSLLLLSNGAMSSARAGKIPCVYPHGNRILRLNSL